MKFRIIEDQRETFPVRVLCDVMAVSPAAPLNVGIFGQRSFPQTTRSVRAGPRPSQQTRLYPAQTTALPFHGPPAKYQAAA